MRTSRHITIYPLVLLLCMPAYSFAQRLSPVKAGRGSRFNLLPSIKYSEFKLPNGLRVILHEDHSTPIVAVNLWYHVGSKNEVPGRTGFAHLFEHMMFQGSKHYDSEFFRPLQEAGGTLNGSTNADRTNYWEVVPSNFLELALWLEADRMGYLLEAMTEEKLANQRDVVKNEKRQNYDNRPYGLVPEKIASAMYPEDHPYHWLTIGSLEDVTAATMEDVQDFFRRFYTPNNASLVIAGDFEPAEARRLVEKHYGSIKHGPDVSSVRVPQPYLKNEIRMVLEDRVALPRLYLIWHSVPQFSADDAALDTLATILSSSKSARLYKSLVYDRQIAQDASAFHSSREIAGQFQIVATARPGKTLKELQELIDSEIEKIRSEPPMVEEISRAYNQREASFIYGLQTVGGFGGKSDQLNLYATFLGKPSYFDEDLARYQRVTAADVQRVARQYLDDKRLILEVVPGQRDGGGRRTEPSAGEVTQSNRKKKSDSANEILNASNLPKPKPDPSLKLPPIQRRRLPNGLELVTVEHHEIPVVNMNLVLKTGGEADPRGKTGLATLAADMLDEGAKNRSAIEIAESLARIGARVATGSGWDASYASLLTLRRHLKDALDIYAEVITAPSFPNKELERLKAQRLAELKQRRDNANDIASTAYAALLYGLDHPYGHMLIGDEASIDSITVEDVRNFYESFYRPNNATLIVVGDVEPDEIAAQVQQAFHGWKNTAVPTVVIPPPPTAGRTSVFLVDRPHSAQSVISIGHIGVARSTPDYFPLMVLNTILGGQFTSRVNLNLREDKGYTYGARTSFDFRIGPGPFIATAGVQTAVTREAVVEFLKEINGIRGAVPIKPVELDFAKQAIIRAYPRGFETPSQIAGRLADVIVYGLPDDYFNHFIANVQAVTLDDVKRVANRYLDPSHMAILIVGDRVVVESRLQGLDGSGGLTVIDVNARPLAAS